MAIAGRKKNELTIDTILEHISSYDIYRAFFGNFNLNEVTCNHLRGDKSPSFIIGNKYGHVSHYDFGDSEWRGDAFNLVKQIYKCDLDTALRIIDKEFGLGLVPENPTKEFKKRVSEYEQPEVTKRNTLIQIKTRKFTSDELAYWKQYHFDIQDLKDNNIYSIKELYLNKKKFNLKETDIRFGYFYDGYWKCYFPLKGKKEKWFPNNVPIHIVDGKENIKDCDTAFIGKSKKDMMTIKKIFPCSASVQNEGIACFTPENVEYFKSNSKRQILSFDADDPGVKNSLQITQLFGFDYCNVPKRYLASNCKDWSDVSAKFGLKEVEKILKEYKII